MVALGLAITRASLPSGLPGPIPPQPRRRMTRTVAAAVGVTVLTLFVLLIASVSTGRAIASLGAPKATVVKLTGHQWWWEVEYDDPVAGRIVETANEIHIPAGRPVLVQLQSHDVIHSFWVPSLHGKRDLIPGHDSEIWIQADRPGVYRGLCAEFCGNQHGNMGFLHDSPRAAGAVQRPGPFDQLRPAVLAGDPAPAAPSGGCRRVPPCAVCHNMQGTQASRPARPRPVAPGAEPPTAPSLQQPSEERRRPGPLDRRSAGPSSPAAPMPPTSLSSEDLQAVLAYLGSLWSTRSLQ